MLPCLLSQVLNEGELVADGTVKILAAEESEYVEAPGWGHKKADSIPHDPLYRGLQRTGFCFGPRFQSLQNVTSDLSEARLLWDGEWVTFLDGMIQFAVMNGGKLDDSVLHVPVRMQRMLIRPPAAMPASADVQLLADGVTGVVRTPFVTVEVRLMIRDPDWSSPSPRHHLTVACPLSPPRMWRWFSFPRAPSALRTCTT